MKAFVAAIAALIVITVGANYALNAAGFSIQDLTTSPSVRLG
jgi:hypothetical protein